MKAKAAFAGFSVTDLESAKRFYTQTLGLELDSETMGLEIKLPNGGSIFLYQKDDHQPATYTVLNLIVEDIDIAVDELMANGVVFERYPDLPFEQDEKGIARARSPKDGPTICWFKDPAGNILSLIQS